MANVGILPASTRFVAFTLWQNEANLGLAKVLAIAILQWAVDKVDDA